MRLREADAFRVLVVQDFEGVTVEDGDDGASEVGCERGACRNQAANDYDEVGAQKRLAIGRRLYHSQAAKMVRHH